MLAPPDFQRAETWFALGIPIQVALRAIDRAFRDFTPQHPRDRIRGLAYCEGAVQKEFHAWRQTRIGAAEQPSAGVTSPNEEAKTRIRHLADRLRDAPCRSDFASEANLIIDSITYSLEVLLRDPFDRFAADETLDRLDEDLFNALTCNLADEGQLQAMESEVMKSFPRLDGFPIDRYLNVVGKKVYRLLLDQHQLPRLTLIDL